eukprot:31036-Pelagococcus_subviridis.AAC.15
MTNLTSFYRSPIARLSPLAHDERLLEYKLPLLVLLAPLPRDLVLPPERRLALDAPEIPDRVQARHEEPVLLLAEDYVRERDVVEQVRAAVSSLERFGDDVVVEARVRAAHRAAVDPARGRLRERRVRCGSTTLRRRERLAFDIRRAAHLSPASRTHGTGRIGGEDDAGMLSRRLACSSARAVSRARRGVWRDPACGSRYYRVGYDGCGSGFARRVASPRVDFPSSGARKRLEKGPIDSPSVALIRQTMMAASLSSVSTHRGVALPNAPRVAKARVAKARVCAVRPAPSSFSPAESRQSCQPSGPLSLPLH